MTSDRQRAPNGAKFRAAQAAGAAPEDLGRAWARSGHSNAYAKIIMDAHFRTNTLI
jgi:hypothetical protein